MDLFIDTETTGIPKNWKAPVTDLDNWPRMVQIAWLLYDNSGYLVDEKNYIIRPDGFTIPSDVAAIHKITTDIALATGNNLTRVLRELSTTIDNAENIIAHNLSFDEKIIGAEFLRKNIPHKLFQKTRICTMEETTNFCALPGNYGYKWPKLSELHYKLFATNFEESHNAAADIKATAKCFWELKSRGFFSSITTGYYPPEQKKIENKNPPIQNISTEQNTETVRAPSISNFNYAGFWFRFGATFIDGILLFIINTIIAFIFQLQIIHQIAEVGPFVIFRHPLFIITSWLYFAVFESSSYQATPGKLAVNIKLINLQGNKISFLTATGRHWGKWISLLIVYIGFIMVGFTKRKQGLHDQMANCLVIKK